MLIDKRWNNLTPEDWSAFAQAWLAELRAMPSTKAVEPAGDTEKETVSATVVRMNFTAAPEHQWRFILAAVQSATREDELGHVAAGPIEHLLGWHGDKFVERVEQQAETDEKFRRALAGVRKYMMSDAVWARVQRLQAGEGEGG